MKKILILTIVYFLFVSPLNFVFSQIQTKIYKLICPNKAISNFISKECEEKVKTKLFEFQKSNNFKNGNLANWFEVKTKNPIYSKVWIENNYVAAYTSGLLTSSNPPFDKKNNGSDYYNFMYRAYVEFNPDENGNKKSQIVLFFSNYNIGYNETKKPFFLEEVANDIDKNQIVLSESNSDKYLEIDNFINFNSINQNKVFSSITYDYDIKSLHPNKKPVIIEKKFDFKPHLLAVECYEKSSIIKQDQNGKVKEIVSFFLKDNGIAYNFEKSEKITDNQKPYQISFTSNFTTSTGVDEPNKILTEWSMGYDFVRDSVFFVADLVKPYSISYKTDEINFKPNLLADIRTKIDTEPVQDKPLLKEFMQNFNQLNEYIILDDKNLVNNKPKKYIYKGTYKNNIPHGWGLIYLTNSDNGEYYFGHFKDGRPDGFGVRNNFKLDGASSLFTKGLHVGKELVYGISSENNFIQYGRFSENLLTGNGLKIYYHTYGYGTIWDGFFVNGKLQGEGKEIATNQMKTGVFDNNQFVSGELNNDRMSDPNYSVGKIIKYQGKRYVIMKKEGGLFHLDDGRTISTKSELALTREFSISKKKCPVCNGFGYFTETTSNTYAGSTSKQKTYFTGPTGYITWEKTTTTTSAPTSITSVKNKKCSCNGGYISTSPVPLNPNKR